MAADVTGAIYRECNEEAHQMTADYPDRFKGFVQIPTQDVALAIDELRRAMVRLWMVGAMINDTVD